MKARLIRARLIHGGFRILAGAASVFYGLAGLAAPGAPPPPMSLPEEARLNGLAPAGESALAFHPAASGDLAGWRHLKIQRGMLDGKTVILSVTETGIAEPKATAVRRVIDRALWSDTGKLIRATRLDRTGEVEQRIEAFWAEGHLIVRTGAGAATPPRQIPSPEPPDADADVLAVLRPLEPRSRRAVRVLDLETGAIEAGTLDRAWDGEMTYRLEQEQRSYEAYAVHSSLRGGITWHFTQDGTCLSFKRAAATLEAIRVDLLGIPLAEARQRTYARPEFRWAFMKQIRAAWRAQGAVHENPALGLAVTLPPGWKRAADDPADAVKTWYAENASRSASVAICVEQVGDDAPLKESARRLADMEAKLSHGKVSLSDVTLGRLPAVRLASLQQGGDVDYLRRAHVVIRRGILIQIQTVRDAPAAAAEKELAALLASVRWVDPKGGF